MNNNSSKQILLSVIGVAILVVAVVGVSFAFFTYTATGTKNNVITTGTLTFTFSEENGSYITLLNQFPIATNTGKALTSGEHGTCEFYIKGNIPSGQTVSYNVYAIKGDDTLTDDTYDSSVQAGVTLAGKTRFDNSHVTMYVEVEPSAQDAAVIQNGYDTPKAIGADINADGLLIAKGTITGNGAEVNTKYTVRMWIDSSVVTVNDQNGTTTGPVYTSAAFAQKFYTMKIKVTV